MRRPLGPRKGTSTPSDKPFVGFGMSSDVFICRIVGYSIHTWQFISVISCHDINAYIYMHTTISKVTWIIVELKTWFMTRKRSFEWYNPLTASWFFILGYSTTLLHTWRSWGFHAKLLSASEANLLLKKLMFGAPGYVVIWCSRASCHWSCWETKVQKKPGLKNTLPKIWCGYRNNVYRTILEIHAEFSHVYFQRILVFTFTTTFGMVWFLFSIDLLEVLLGVWGAMWHKHCNSNGFVIHRNLWILDAKWI